MTAREAIEVITEYRPILGWKKYSKALDIAISALEEREERSKGCKYCTVGDGEFTILLDKWGEEDFCQMCGRKLKEDNK